MKRSAISEYAWCKDNSNGTPHRVATKKPNLWGLFDMHGNVYEWVEDDWHGNYEGAPADGFEWVNTSRGYKRVMRGGSFGGDSVDCRSTEREDNFRWACVGYLGFRLAMSIPNNP